MHDISNIDFKIISLLSVEQAHSFQVIPFKQEDNSIHFFISEESKPKKAQLQFVLGKKVVFEKADAAEFEKQLYTYYPANNQPKQQQKERVGDESDIIQFVDKVFEEAISIKASDIHIERYESYARIRFRWEGKLLEKYEVPLEKYRAMVSRIKILADLDISERRLPQDGRIHLDTHEQKIDVRVSTVPSKFGEKVVMRLLTRSAKFLQLENLGMQSIHMTEYLRAIRQPNGIILITGPTGSGKTTTLYASLNIINQAETNIMTIEDPIEYNIEGINQVQLKEEIGLSFDKALRAFLRQDPDVIMVGEVRDRATAEIAIRAALTGHLVLSTLHTNSALDAIVRLLDMGVAPYLLAASLRLVVAQRLIRILCPECKRKSSNILDEAIQQQYQLLEHHEAGGCVRCNYTGYTRRRAIYEIVSLTEELAESIKRDQLNKREYYAKHPKQPTLKGEVLKLLKAGETSLSEGMMYLVG